MQHNETIYLGECGAKSKALVYQCYANMFHRTTGHIIWCKAAQRHQSWAIQYISLYKGVTLMICDQMSIGATSDEGNYTDMGNMREINYTKLMEGKIGIGACVN